MAITRRQCDSAERGESRRDVHGGRLTVILAGANAVAHPQDWDTLVVVIRSAVPGGVGASLPGRCAVHQPVRLGYDEQIAAAAWKVTVGHRQAERAVRRGTIH